MRRTVATVITLAVALFGAACEDGPSQTFTPEPPGAGNVINGPGGGTLVAAQGGAFTGSASQSFDAGTGGGQNANVLCNATQIEATRKQCFGAPISPPGLGACLDIAGGPTSNGGSGWEPGDNPATYYNPTTETWTGATVEQAEAILCQATPFQFYQGLTNSVAWGDAAEVGVLYNTANRQITDILLQTGYEGGLSATSVDGKTNWDVVLNGKPLVKTDVQTGAQTSIILDWNTPAGVTQINIVADALYDALRNKYSPDTPTDEGCSDPVAECCVDAGHCIIGNNGTGGGYFYYTPLGLAIFVNTTVGTMQQDSTFTLIDQQLVKNLPFSNSAVTMKLDSMGEGPVSLTTNALNTGKNCRYIIGQTFTEFNDNCVEVFPNNTDAGAANNIIETKKLFGALNHTDETYLFNVVGVDPNFTATLGPQEVVSDITTPLISGEAQEPSGNDFAFALNIDQNFLGVIANDFTGNDATQAQDWHGIGLVTLETANLVQQYMKSAYGVTADLGDTECAANPSAPATAGKVCSGLEGILTSAPPASVVGLPATYANNAVGPAAININNNIAVGLKPSTWYASFCSDGGGVDGMGNPIGYNNCTQDYYFTAFQNAVASSFPAGTTVPVALADRRFFFQQWILALVKYLHVAADPNATLATIDAAESTSDDIYFDSNGGGFESGAYVDRTAVNSLGEAPTVLTVGTNLTTSVLNNYSFTRFNTRGETAVYTALTTNPSDKLGSERQLISNVVGSPVLVAAYGNYACATNTTAVTASCPCVNGTSPATGADGGVEFADGGGPDGGTPLLNCPLAPVDAFGTPLYASYAPAFGQSFLNIAANGAAPTASPMTVVATTQTGLVQSANVTIPIWSNPFDPTTATASDKTVTKLLPYFPMGANVGFPVTIDGSRDKFYNTFNVDFSGSSIPGEAAGSISASVDYEYVELPGADGGLTNSLVVRAVETTSYLGLVFACAEPNASGGTDILSVRMYDNATEIFAFLAQYPTAVTDCGIEIKYSIYGNYPDYISSLTNGVRFGLNPGFGGSVVSDVTLFDPNVVAALGM